MLCKVHNLLNLCLRTEHAANGELLRASRTWVSTSEIYAKHLGALVLRDDALQKKCCKETIILFQSDFKGS